MPNEWKFTSGDKQDKGFHCAHTSDHRKTVCVNACEGMEHPEEVVADMKTVLKHMLARLEHGPNANPNDGLLHDVRKVLKYAGVA